MPDLIVLLHMLERKQPGHCTAYDKLTFGEMPLSRNNLMTISLRVRRLSTHSIRPHSSFKGVTAYVLISIVRKLLHCCEVHQIIHMRRLLDSTSLFKNLLIMLLNSMRR